jgi:lysophospholipid acyltransferase (LPLAT)-like uncharacterized protein
VRPVPQRLVRPVAWLAAWSLRALAATWRIETVGRNPMDADERSAALGAFWHENVLVTAALFRARGVTASVSRSRDGDLISAVLRQLGYAPPARGSSSSGGVSLLRQLIRRLQEGCTVALPVDGPRGPAFTAKPGVVSLAARTGVAITPVIIEASPATRFASWDRTRLPWPFARIVLTFGDPVQVSRGISDTELIEECRRLEQALGR